MDINFDVTAKITTDRGSNFNSTTFRQLSKLLGSNHIKSTAYHSAANCLLQLPPEVKDLIGLNAFKSFSSISELHSKKTLDAIEQKYYFDTTLRLQGECSFSSICPKPPRLINRPSTIQIELSICPFVFL